MTSHDITRTASAAASAETPHPSPVDYTEVAKELRNTHRKYANFIPDVVQIALSEAAQVIEAQAAENERATANAQGWHRVVETVCTIIGLSPALGADEAATAIRAKFDATHARIAELEKERDEAFTRGQDSIFDAHHSEYGETPSMTASSRDIWKARAEAAESRLADAVKVIEEIANGAACLPGYSISDAAKAARSFLSTGGDSHG